MKIQKYPLYWWQSKKSLSQGCESRKDLFWPGPQSGFRFCWEIDNISSAILPSSIYLICNYVKKKTQIQRCILNIKISESRNGRKRIYYHICTFGNEVKWMFLHIRVPWGEWQGHVAPPPRPLGESWGWAPPGFWYPLIFVLNAMPFEGQMSKLSDKFRIKLFFWGGGRNPLVNLTVGPCL